LVQGALLTEFATLSPSGIFVCSYLGHRPVFCVLTPWCFQATMSEINVSRHIEGGIIHEETFSTSFNDCSTFDWYGNRYSNGDAQDRHRAGFLYFS